MKHVPSLSQRLITLLLCLLLIVSAVLSTAVGLARSYIRGFKDGWTLDWVIQVWGIYHALIWMSLLVALCTLMIVLATGVSTGYVLVCHQGRTSRSTGKFLALPVTLPGLVTTLRLIVAYGGFGGFRESLWFIAVGYMMFTLPFMMRSVAAMAAGQGLKMLEEDVASLGVSFWRRFHTIVLPNVQPGVLAGALTVATLLVGELNLTWMLYTPEIETLPVGLADTCTSMRLEITSVYMLIFFAMIVSLLVLVQRFGGLRASNGRASQ